jgi:hypothetical protein
MATDRDTAPVPHDHVVFTDLDGAEGVVVDLDTKQYFQLNDTASFIWQGLARGLDAERIAEALTADYEVTLEHARASVAAALRDFARHRLTTCPPARSAP